MKNRKSESCGAVISLIKKWGLLSESELLMIFLVGVGCAQKNTFNYTVTGLLPGTQVFIEEQRSVVVTISQNGGPFQATCSSVSDLYVSNYAD